MPKGIKRFAPNATFGLRLIEGEGSATGTTSTTIEPTIDGAKPSDQGKPDEQLGENGKKALDREREARKNLEGQFTQMREAFATALGIKADSKADPNEAIAALTDQVASIQHENAVLRLANQHNITDEGDLALLRSTKDPEALGPLAARLAVKADDTSNPTPKPDLTQGSKGGEGIKPEVLPGVPRMAAALEEQFAKK